MSAYLSLIGKRTGWSLIRGWVLINFFCFSDGRLFEVGAYSRLGAYSNKYGKILISHGLPTRQDGVVNRDKVICS